MTKRMFSRSVRSRTHKLGRFLGDLQASGNGNPRRITKRVGRRLVGRAIGKGLKKIFR